MGPGARTNEHSLKDTIRIGGASGAWGDSPGAIPQLVAAGVDYLVMDYLAEVTMSLLARARMKDPAFGFPPAVSYTHLHESGCIGSDACPVPEG